MPKVYNKYHKDAPKDAVYIGRPSKWGNPFSHKQNTRYNFAPNREQAVHSFELMVESDPEFKQAIKDELKGKDLVCFCKPRACHGDVLLRIANEEDELVF